MKINIDSDKKVIILQESVNLQQFIEEVDELLGEELGQYTLEVGSMIFSYPVVNPYTPPFVPYTPVNPTYNPTWVTCSTDGNK